MPLSEGAWKCWYLGCAPGVVGWLREQDNFSLATPSQVIRVIYKGFLDMTDYFLWVCVCGVIVYPNFWLFLGTSPIFSSTRSRVISRPWCNIPPRCGYQGGWLSLPTSAGSPMKCPGRGDGPQPGHRVHCRGPLFEMKSMIFRKGCCESEEGGSPLT